MKDLVALVKHRRKRCNTRVAYMLALCVIKKWNLCSWKKSYIPPTYICVISECRLFEGMEISKIPDGFKAWYLSPEHYAEYQTLIK